MPTVVDRLSWPGWPERANEDACGAAGDWAWVIDASIAAGHAPVLHAQSDAAWFAEFASAHFAALAPAAGEGADLIGRVVAEARAAFFAAVPPERHDPLSLSWPMAALTLVRCRDGRLDAWTLADTAAYVLAETGRCRTLGEAPALREAEARAAAELLRRTGVGADEIGGTAEFRAWLAETRRRAVERGIVPVFTLHPACLDQVRHESLDLDGPAAVLLASDGFSALVERYRALDARRLVERALAEGLEPLAQDLRRIEAETDPDGRRFPRLKRSDDATALLLRM